MKIVTKLSGVAETDPAYVHQPMSAVHHEVAPGCFLFLNLGPTGLLVGNGVQALAIPLTELVGLAQAHEPQFTPKEA